MCLEMSECDPSACLYLSCETAVLVTKVNVNSSTGVGAMLCSGEGSDSKAPMDDKRSAPTSG